MARAVSAWPGDRREGPSVASRRGSAYRARRVVAETTAANAAAIKVLRRCSAVLVFDGSQVHAEIPVRPASSAADTESDS